MESRYGKQNLATNLMVDIQLSPNLKTNVVIEDPKKSWVIREGQRLQWIFDKFKGQKKALLILKLKSEDKNDDFVMPKVNISFELDCLILSDHAPIFNLSTEPK